MEYSHIFVCLMGMGTVFFGLICLIVLTGLMGRACRCESQEKSLSAEPESVSLVPPTPLLAGANLIEQEIAAIIAAVSAATDSGNHQEIAAAISAVIAEELGPHVTGIRITSMKKL